MTSSEIDPLMLDLFRVELENNTRVLEEGLVSAEKDQTPERIEPLMRAAHSIKGAARIVGLNRAVTLAHAMEDVLSAAQRGEKSLTSEAVDMLLEGNDFFSGLSRLQIDELPDALEKGTLEIQLMSDHLRAFLSSETSTVQKTGLPSSEEDKTVEKPEVKETASSPPAGASRVPVVREKAESGLVRVRAENMNRLMALAGESLIQSQSVKALFQGILELKNTILELEQSLRHILEISPESENRAHEEEVNRAFSKIAIAEEGISIETTRFEHFSRRMEYLSTRLYNEVIDSRMVPFADGLHGFSRMVRDLARETGKQVMLEISGADTPVDREILEKLEAPLSHLIRNAIDHGIETRENRVKKGKKPEGTITLAARHVAGMLSISMTDDGKGIDTNHLREKVVEKGYVTHEMALSLSNAELFEFLFLPGFSTAGKVTEISGRGVGLDVVMNMAHEVGGSVRVDSKPDKGTEFTLQLPLTLSVLRALLLSIDNEPYALPLSRIDRVLFLESFEIMEIEDRPYCDLDGEHVGILDARQLLQLSGDSTPSEKQTIIIISDRLNRYGLAVDRVMGEQSLVVRTLDSRLGKIPNISSCAILDDGSPVVIFDVDDLVRSIHQLLTTGRLHKIGKGQNPAGAGKKHILIVDDSLTVREVERRLLENAGYEVTTAVDGVDGWNTLTMHSFDLLISDVDMPRMNGIELVRNVRNDKLLREIPIMIVSYKDRREDRMMGLEAGANYYLTKSSFHDEGLLTAVRDLIGGP